MVDSSRSDTNTFHDNGQAGWGGGILVDNSEVIGLVIRNNICSQNSDFQIADEASAPHPTIDHNLIDGTQNYAGAINGTDSQTGDPLFADATAADYHIQLGSPARDNGSAAGAPAMGGRGASRIPDLESKSGCRPALCLKRRQQLPLPAPRYR